MSFTTGRSWFDGSDSVSFMFYILLTSGPLLLHPGTMLGQVEAKEEEEGSTLDSKAPERA